MKRIKNFKYTFTELSITDKGILNGPIKESKQILPNGREKVMLKRINIVI